MGEKKYFFLLVILINALIGQSQTNKQPEFQLTSEKFDSAFNYLFIESLNYPNNEIKIDSTGRVKLKSANNFLISSGDYVGQVPNDKFSKIKQYLYEFLNEDNNKKNQNPQYTQDFKVIIKSNKVTYDFVISIKSMFYEDISQMLFSNKSLLENKLTPFFWYNKRDSLDSSFAFDLRKISFPVIMGESYLLFIGQIQYANTIILNQKPIKYDYIKVDSITGKSKKLQITTSNKKEVYLYRVKVDSIYSGNSQYCTYEGADLKGKYVYCLSDKLLQLNLKRPYGVIGIHKNFETINLVSKEKKRLSYVEMVDVFNPDINFTFNYFNRRCSEFYTKWQTYKSRGPKIKKSFSKNQKIIQNAILKNIKKDSIYCDIEPNYSFIENSKASFFNRLNIKYLLKKNSIRLSQDTNKI